MNTWTERQLGELIHIKHGFAFSGDYIVDYDNGVVLVTPGNFKIGGGFKHSGKKFFSGEIPDDYILQGNALIVTMTDLSKNADTLGYAAYVPNDEKTYLHNQRIGLVSIISDDINESFLYWLLRTPWYQRRIANTCNGANVKHTSPDRIYKYKFLLPTLSEQKNIAKILSAYDNLIEANNRRIELLEQTAQELYKEWFVRFRFPGYESIKFENGIPEDWNVSKLSQISDFVYGKMPQQEHVVEKGFPIFSGYRVSGYYDSFMFEEPMLVLIARGVGGTGEVKISPPCAHITNLAIVFKLNNPDLHKRYLYHMFTLQNLRYLDTGAAQSQITIENLKNVKVILPTDGLLEKFNKIIAPFYEEQDRLKSINENLINQRDLLLPRLISGKLEVRQINGNERTFGCVEENVRYRKTP